ncbi:DEAD/DEAH box helicase [Roseibacillus ishigakijimensis]|uniref:DEAD/DEAH box helicase n=1 Tax=Roseibacillus ishigakijimensis TaxID=454146 RepID=A0A934RJ54_9BACT|nr:DEAD/DEAH box helicase [Roseibacillus ishigakijimensis]MBK1832612.1 DEAD/DEAH box helicase [Roseibacillus ishigakijimensis]
MSYCLECEPYAHSPYWSLLLRPATLTKTGQIKPKNNESHYTPTRIPKYFDKEDKVPSLQYLALINESGLYAKPAIQGEGWAEIILQALERNRLLIRPDALEKHWEVVTSGAPISVKPNWHMTAEGLSQPILEIPENHHLFFCQPPLALNFTDFSLHPVESPFSVSFLETWQSGPAFQPTEAQALSRQLANRQDAKEIPTPRELKKEKLPATSPRPHLHIHLGEPHRWFRSENILASPTFRYHHSPLQTPLTSRQSLSLDWIADDTNFSTPRNRKEEKKRLKELASYGLEAITNAIRESDLDPTYRSAYFYEPDDSLSPKMDWLQFLSRQRPELEQAGWTIEVAPECGLKVRAISDFTPALQEDPAHGIDWFQFDFSADVEGEPLSLIPYIAYAIETDLFEEEGREALPDPLPLPHPEEEEGYLAFPRDRFLDICQSVAHLFIGREVDGNQPLTIDRIAAASLAHELNLNADQIMKDLAAFGQKLAGITSLPKKAPPKMLQAELRPYQLEGYRWLRFLAENKLNGILADDMGLGKTVQTLAFLASLPTGPDTPPSLIVAPTSVITNWLAEAKRFTPGLQTLLLQGQERKEKFPDIPKAHLVLTSYPLLHRDRTIFLGQQWNAVILDEAQAIKNAKTHAAQVACQLQSKHRFCLSGTPMENHLGELWSLMNFAMPGYLGNSKTFQSTIRKPIEQESDSMVQATLNRRVAPLILRRTKDEVALDLPEKTEILHHIELSKKERDLYESVRASMDKRVREALAAKGLAKSHIIILDALLKLRQICCHPRLLKTPGAQKIATGSKMTYLTQDLLPELFAEGRRILLFSQFTSILTLLEKELQKEKIPFLKLTGQSKKRAELVATFQNENIPIFLISLKAGGTGLNLTAADTVIHYDPWWNPAAENQATDRAHRIGQHKAVFVHKLICQGSIEERIVDLQKQKAKLVKSLLSKETTRLQIDSETLSHLLSPLAQG